MQFPTRMTRQQRVRLVLSNLMQANLALKLARRECAADPGAEAMRKHDSAKAAADELQEVAQRLVTKYGTAKDRARLAALLNVRLLWLLSLSSLTP